MPAPGRLPPAPGEHCRPSAEPHRRPHRRHAARGASSRGCPPVGGAGAGDRPGAGARTVDPACPRAATVLDLQQRRARSAGRLIASGPGAAAPGRPGARRSAAVAEVLRLADAMGPRSRAMVITQAGLGLRLGELLALRMQDIAFLRRTVGVESQTAPRTKTRTEPKPPPPRRTTPPPQVVADALAAHIAEHPPGADGSPSSPTPARST